MPVDTLRLCVGGEVSPITLADNMEPRRFGKASGYPIMQRGRDSELIFPIKDAASAALMLIKADCLLTAGIINEAEKQYVHSRARTFLNDQALKDAAFLKSYAAYNGFSAGAFSVGDFETAPRQTFPERMGFLPGRGHAGWRSLPLR